MPFMTRNQASTAINTISPTPETYEVVASFQESKSCLPLLCCRPQASDKSGAIEHDEYMHLADLPMYLAAQDKAGAAFNDRAGWARRAILNVARIGKFSSDRTAAEYVRDIWDLQRVVVQKL